MKCPSCGRNQPAKAGLKCFGCHYRFTFNPKEPATAGLTDGKFLSAVKRAGQNGTAAFTDNQLYAVYAAKIKSPRIVLIVIACVVAGAGIVIFRASRVAGLVVLGISAAIFVLALIARAPVLRRERFLAGVQKWLDQGKPIEGLLQEPSLGTPPESWNEQDIYDYGAERVLIVQRDLLVDLMVKNNQHSEQRMLVIAESGYPQYLIPHVNRLLDERSDLPVYLLHDADAAGASMAQRVCSLSWLHLGNHPVIDMGFFSHDFEKLKRTRNFENQQSERSLPADALLMGTLVTGLGACFAAQSTLGDEIMREHQNQMNANSSFG